MICLLGVLLGQALSQVEGKVPSCFAYCIFLDISACVIK